MAPQIPAVVEKEIEEIRQELNNIRKDLYNKNLDLIEEEEKLALADKNNLSKIKESISSFNAKQENKEKSPYDLLRKAEEEEKKINEKIRQGIPAEYFEKEKKIISEIRRDVPFIAARPGQQRTKWAELKKDAEIIEEGKTSRTESRGLINELNNPLYNNSKGNWLGDTLSTLDKDSLRDNETREKIKEVLNEESQKKLSTFEKIRGSLIYKLKPEEYLRKKIDKKLPNKLEVIRLSNSKRVSSKDETDKTDKIEQKEGSNKKAKIKETLKNFKEDVENTLKSNKARVGYKTNSEVEKLTTRVQNSYKSMRESLQEKKPLSLSTKNPANPPKTLVKKSTRER